MGKVAELLEKLLQNSSGRVEYDTQWTSPCVILPPDNDNMVCWLPVAMAPAPELAALPLRPEIIEFFSSFWAWGWEGRHVDQVVMLCLPWNADHLAAITESLAAQLAAGEPVLIATSDWDGFFAVDSASGAVWLCEPGQPRSRLIAASLASFLASLV